MPLATTFRAGLLYGEEALLHTHLANAAARVARLRRGTRTAAATAARIAIDQCRYANFDFRATHRVFERQRQIVTQIAAPICPIATTTGAPLTENITKHCVKNVAEPGTAATPETAGALLHPGVAELVIGRTFIRVAQHFECFFCFLELGLGGVIPFVAIRVMLHGQSAIGLLDVGVARRALDPEDFVIITLRHS